MYSLLLALLQSPAGAPAGQPVRVTLDPATVAPGEAVHVFVEVATAGHLLVLRVAADGRTEVVFPGQPTEGTFVSAGTYEIQPSGRTAAFFANERVGGGVVLAALALVPYEFDEFTRGGAWDAAALASATGSDATGRLLDIVQRMLGPEYFHYDVAAYTVAPYTTAESDVIGDAYGGFVSSWGWGYWPGGWWGGWAPARPCLDGRWDCGWDSGWCGGFGHRGGCDRTCRDRFGCGEWSRQTAVARYRRGDPLFASGAPSRSSSPTEPSLPSPIRPRRRVPVEQASAALAAARLAPRDAGKSVAPAGATGARTTRTAVARRPRERALDGARLPERVAWPGTVIASGRKTATPAVRPRDAAVKQSASRPPMPERVPWPTGAVPRAWRPGSGAVAVSAPAVPRVGGAVAVDRSVGARGGAAAISPGSTRSLASATGARAAVREVAPARVGDAVAGGAAQRGASMKGGSAASAGGARAYAPARAATGVAAPRVGGAGKP